MDVVACEKDTTFALRLRERERIFGEELHCSSSNVDCLAKGDVHLHSFIRASRGWYHIQGLIEVRLTLNWPCQQRMS